jgi:hypothetical protein
VWKAIVAGVVLAWASSPAAAADLTSTELRWLRGGWPVVAYAKAAGMPLDVVVQPQPTPGLPPLRWRSSTAAASSCSRCAAIPRRRRRSSGSLRAADAALELMTAHELGHCRRYLDGAWYGVPAGFSHALPAGLSESESEAYRNETAARREEGYGDLVGLAWTAARHPQHYARLHAWLLAERAHDRVPGSAHDTLAWVRLRRRCLGLGGESDAVRRAGAAVARRPRRRGIATPPRR